MKARLLPLVLMAAAGVIYGQDKPAPQPRPVIPRTRSFSASALRAEAATLVFDQTTKEYKAAHGEALAPFKFKLINVASNDLVITAVKPSCGCTTAHMPPLPWRLKAGESGEVTADVNLAGKLGLITKTILFESSAGTKVLTLKVNIIPPPPPGELTPGDREAAMAAARADAHAIFHGDCVTCHVEKGRHALGQELYAADCAICHESPHRASSVPDLHALKGLTDLSYWKTIITSGKPSTTMPGFAQAQGGPLTADQILSLAVYLDRTISHHF